VGSRFSVRLREQPVLADRVGLLLGFSGGKNKTSRGLCRRWTGKFAVRVQRWDFQPARAVRFLFWVDASPRGEKKGTNGCKSGAWSRSSGEGHSEDRFRAGLRGLLSICVIRGARPEPKRKGPDPKGTVEVSAQGNRFLPMLKRARPRSSLWNMAVVGGRTGRLPFKE